MSGFFVPLGTVHTTTDGQTYVFSLIDQDMAPGAGLAFLIAGGVTSFPAAVAVFALARLPVFIAYLTFALTGSIMAGLAYGLMV